MAERITQLKEHSYVGLPLTNLAVAEKGKRAYLDVTTGKIVVAATSSSIDLGEFAETRTGNGTQGVMVRLHRELVSRRWANDGVAPLAAADVGRICFVKDDSTVSKSSTGGRMRAGMVIGVDTIGVLVVSLMDAPMPSHTGPTLAFVSNDAVVPDFPRPGAIYDIPTSAGVSTVTLPANTLEGTEVTFVADGTKNGHTVQYRDATGPTNLTTALTASKRHLVRCAFLNGRWVANAYVAP
jgi:hypothetical protein